MVRYPIPGILFAREHREKKREKNRGGVCPALLFYVLVLLFILIAISCCPIAVRDCSEAPLTSGVHKISLNQGSELLPVYCDQTADGGGNYLICCYITLASMQPKWCVYIHVEHHRYVTRVGLGFLWKLVRPVKNPKMLFQWQSPVIHDAISRHWNWRHSFQKVCSCVVVLHTLYLRINRKTMNVLFFIKFILITNQSKL